MHWVIFGAISAVKSETPQVRDSMPTYGKAESVNLNEAPSSGIY